MGPHACLHICQTSLGVCLAVRSNCAGPVSLLLWLPTEAKQLGELCLTETPPGAYCIDRPHLEKGHLALLATNAWQTGSMMSHEAQNLVAQDLGALP